MLLATEVMIGKLVPLTLILLQAYGKPTDCVQSISAIMFVLCLVMSREPVNALSTVNTHRTVNYVYSFPAHSVSKTETISDLQTLVLSILYQRKLFGYAVGTFNCISLATRDESFVLTGKYAMHTD